MQISFAVLKWHECWSFQLPFEVEIPVQLHLELEVNLLVRNVIEREIEREKVQMKPPLQALKRKGLSRAFEALKAFFFFCTAAKSVVLNNVWKRVCENFYLTTLQKMFSQ